MALTPVYPTNSGSVTITVGSSSTNTKQISDELQRAVSTFFGKFLLTIGKFNRFVITKIKSHYKGSTHKIKLRVGTREKNVLKKIQQFIKALDGNIDRDAVFQNVVGSFSSLSDINPYIISMHAH